MGRGFQGAVLKMLRAPEHELAIIKAREAPPYTELTVQCPSLLGPGTNLPPTSWVRMWIPEGGREHQRAYTLTCLDREAATAQILVLHHDPAGPASRWALRAEPGSSVSVQLLGGTSYRTPADGDRMLLVGDLASAPAIAEAVEAAPPGCTVEVVMLAHADDWLPRASRPHRMSLVDPEAAEAVVLEEVDGAIGATARGGAPDWTWVALEMRLNRAVRRHLVSSGLERRSIQHQAYWVRGRAMGTTSSASSPR
ncbi:siderophore-interacting protein [Actinomyces slackii]|uniref:Iron import ATP-binding/permease protein IrtA n=1 Tax=Actinomyces slackii TaxID=52774 RepID=A0A448KAT7_9ACTO|nr:siderophore-interacting protein [Actinomyces slackii]VEG74022.1 Iron import ATP-binding/permease protein IrtA [Actinomyces slackii]